jgi:hypothetical protein
MKYSNDDVGYVFEAADMRLLNAVKKRLYAPERLDADGRRELANRLDAIMHRVLSFEMKHHPKNTISDDA